MSLVYASTEGSPEPDHFAMAAERPYDFNSAREAGPATPVKRYETRSRAKKDGGNGTLIRRVQYVESDTAEEEEEDGDEEYKLEPSDPDGEYEADDDLQQSQASTAQEEGSTRHCTYHPKSYNPMKDENYRSRERGHGGSLEFYDEVEDNWIPAVKHHEIRAQLIATASEHGLYEYRFPVAREEGPLGADDVTAFHLEQQCWYKDQHKVDVDNGDDESQHVHHVRDDILAMEGDGRDYTGLYDGEAPERWIEDGRLVIDRANFPMYKFPDLPLTLSSALEPWLLVAYLRLDRRITNRDIWARCPPNSGHLTKYSNKVHRFCIENGLEIWNKRTIHRRRPAKFLRGLRKPGLPRKRSAPHLTQAGAPKKQQRRHRAPMARRFLNSNRGNSARVPAKARTQHPKHPSFGSDFESLQARLAAASAATPALTPGQQTEPDAIGELESSESEPTMLYHTPDLQQSRASSALDSEISGTAHHHVEHHEQLAPQFQYTPLSTPQSIASPALPPPPQFPLPPPSSNRFPTMHYPPRLPPTQSQAMSNLDAPIYARMPSAPRMSFHEGQALSRSMFESYDLLNSRPQLVSRASFPSQSSYEPYSSPSMTNQSRSHMMYSASDYDHLAHSPPPYSYRATPTIVGSQGRDFSRSFGRAPDPTLSRDDYHTYHAMHDNYAVAGNRVSNMPAYPTSGLNGGYVHQRYNGRG